jgi:hypothetical protein
MLGTLYHIKLELSRKLHWRALRSNVVAIATQPQHKPPPSLSGGGLYTPVQCTRIRWLAVVVE